MKYILPFFIYKKQKRKVKAMEETPCEKRARENEDEFDAVEIRGIQAGDNYRGDEDDAD